MSKPYPKNAPGDFFVGDGECIECRAPEQEAPQLMTHDETGHCYFRRQPETLAEVEEAVSACCVSCVEAVYYQGKDQVVINRLKERGMSIVCLSLPEEERLSQYSPKPSLIKSLLRFLFGRK